MELSGGHGRQCFEPEGPSTGTYAQKHLASLAAGVIRDAACQCRARDLALVIRLQRFEAAEHACTSTQKSAW